jgi:hypothetical protein
MGLRKMLMDLIEMKVDLLTHPYHFSKGRYSDYKPATDFLKWFLYYKIVWSIV